MASSQGKKLTLYVDIVSPFGYMAYWLTRNSPAFTQSSIQITYIPILLGGIMAAAKNATPISITNKKDWIEIERVRTAKALRIPMVTKPPQPFPQATTNTQRALCYIYSTKSQAELIKACDALFKAFWEEGKSPINDVGIIGEALKTKFSESEVREILEGIKSEEAKKTLRANSDEAFKAGAFGLPWYVATNEKGEKGGFWGVDSIGKVLEHLGVEVKGEDGRYKSML